MQEQRIRNRPARRRTSQPHIAPVAVSARWRDVHSALEVPFVGLSDGRVYDPRSGEALDWWGTGMPEFSSMPGSDYWRLEFPDGAVVVCAPGGMEVKGKPQVGQLRVQRSSHHSAPRRLRREVQCGRLPVRVKDPEGVGWGERWLNCPLLMSARQEPQAWPPPAPQEVSRDRMRLTRAQRRMGVSRPYGWF